MDIVTYTCQGARTLHACTTDIKHVNTQRAAGVYVHSAAYAPRMSCVRQNATQRGGHFGTMLLRDESVTAEEPRGGEFGSKKGPVTRDGIYERPPKGSFKINVRGHFNFFASSDPHPLEIKCPEMSNRRISQR